MENQTDNRNLTQQSNELLTMLRDTNLSREYERFVTLERIVEKALPISTIKRYVEPGAVELTLDLHLTRLIESLNLKWNIQSNQIKQIVEDLIDRYQYESIEDFILIFKRARQGEFGELYRLDSAVIFGWMERYLEEKYEAFERIQQKKASEMKIPDNDIDILLTEALKDNTENKGIRPLTEKEIKEEGQEKPKRPTYYPPGEDYVRLANLKTEYGRLHTDLNTGNKKQNSPSFDEWILTKTK